MIVKLVGGKLHGEKIRISKEQNRPGCILSIPKLFPEPYVHKYRLQGIFTKKYIALYAIPQRWSNWQGVKKLISQVREPSS